MAESYEDEVKRLRERITELEKAGQALYEHAAEIRLHCDAFVVAWADKFEPSALEELRRHRVELFAACERWRAATGKASS